MRIRGYTGSDRDDLLDCLQRMSGEPYPGDLAGPDRESLGRWLDSYASPVRFVAVTDSGAAVGHVQVVPSGGEPDALAEALNQAGVTEYLEIVRLFVDPAARGCGVAAQLLDTATSHVRRQGRVPVLRVQAQLHAARRVYRRAGWREVGAHVSAYSGDTLVVMTSPLSVEPDGQR